MNNILPSTLKYHEKYDLKGSMFKRQANHKERVKSTPTLKDLDFLEEHPGVILVLSSLSYMLYTIQCIALWRYLECTCIMWRYLECTCIMWRYLECTCIMWRYLECTCIMWRYLECTCIMWRYLECTCIMWRYLECTCIMWKYLECTCIMWRYLECTCIMQSVKCKHSTVSKSNFRA